MSELFNKMKMPFLGEPIQFIKKVPTKEPIFKKSHLGKYVLTDVLIEWTAMMSWKTDEYLITMATAPDYDTMYLEKIEVYQKNKGLGTDLLNKILDYCDEKNITLFLGPYPFDLANKPLKAKLNGFLRLKNWYESFGFEPTYRS